VSYEEVSDWQPSTSHVPLADPPTEHTRTIYFLVGVTGTEPPPDWDAKTERILKKELALRMGEGVTVERWAEPVDLVIEKARAFGESLWVDSFNDEDLEPGPA